MPLGSLPAFPLVPRYRLDDVSPWLVGIDPVRRYWLAVNGDAEQTVAVPGLLAPSPQAFRETLLLFRGLEPGDSLRMPAVGGVAEIYCISGNCYALVGQDALAPVWHLFDRESLESLLMTAHADWQCSPKDVELGRRLMQHAWGAMSLAA